MHCTWKNYSFGLLFSYLLGIVAALSLSCANMPVAGSSTETGNVDAIAVQGTIVNEDGSPAEGAWVLIRRKSFTKEIQDSSLVPVPDAIVGKNGIFIVDSLDTGEYFIEIRKETNQKIKSTLITCSLGEDDSLITVSTDTLKSTATINGNVSSPLLGNNRLFVQVYGLERLVEVNSASGAYNIPDLPQGIFTLQIVSPYQFYFPKLLEDIPVNPGSITTLDTVPVITYMDEDYSQWEHAQLCFINTATAGYITEDVTRFPLCIRLDETNFTFTEALFDGSDIRFLKSDGSRLFYEIEHWDAKEKYAAIWVLLDTVYACSTQYVQMYWGNPDAPDRSNSEAVFATENDFAATWHLNNCFDDATANNNDGTNYNSTNITGIIGDARYFDGDSDYVLFGNDSSLANIAQSITVSCWLKTTMASNRNISVIRHNNHFTALQISYTPPQAWTVIWNTDRDILPFAWDGFFNDNMWHHFVVMFDTQTGIRIFRDGALYYNSYTDTLSLATNTTDPFIIGGAEYDCEYYNGQLDEVRVSGTIRSDAWIRLSYESQKLDASLVTFSKRR